jgi:hypothetical protein
VTECPIVQKIVDRAMLACDREYLLDLVTSYTPGEERQRQVQEAIADEFQHITEQQAAVLAGMSDEIITALRRRLTS